ncbi:MAG: T9SS type A sorting domain-containing protein [Bacteroidota bacterium]
MRNLTTYLTTNCYRQYTCDSFAVLDIALQCPITGGNAVFDAIALLNTFYSEIHFNVIENCLNNGLRLENDEFKIIELSDVTAKPEIQLYPNPTEGYFSIDNKTKNSVIFKLFDVIGRVIQVVEIDPLSSISINCLDHYPNGVYAYQIIGDTVTNGLLVKSK